MAALAGGTAGLLGLTGLYGFGFYIFAVIALWVSFILLYVILFQTNTPIVELLFS